MPKPENATPAPSPYSVHPSVAMVRRWIDELPGKTGRSLDAWVALIRAEGPPDERGRRAWLKDNYRLGTNTAGWLAERAGDKPRGMMDEDPEAYLAGAAAYVDGMFAGGKAGLRPLYDRLLALGLGLGADVKACPCQTIVPLYRHHVFAQIKPATRTRIDLGLALKGVDFLPERLIDTGGLAKQDRITHRFAISGLAEIDAEVEAWLQVAYERDA